MSILGFNYNEIRQFKIARDNESMSLLAADLLNYINERLPLIKDNKLNHKRYDGDFIPILDIKEDVQKVVLKNF